MIDPMAILNAEAIVRALPIGVPLPEFAPEPDGSVSLDWTQSRTQQFSLSVGRSHRLSYAWLDGTDSGHGVATFDGSTIPPRIIEGIFAIAKNRPRSHRDYLIQYLTTRTWPGFSRRAVISPRLS